MDDLRAAVLNSLADSACPANAFLLINLSESQSIYKRSSEEVKTMARFIASQGKRFNNRVALVAPDDLPFGLMRMSSVGSEERGIQAEVFRDFAKAWEWLLS
ncbi:MAG: hypothetical protein KGJ59_13110 [Bacteroidota bacterium]|nr:hypothetical protein [Bacteroidota bacterium]